MTKEQSMSDLTVQPRAKNLISRQTTVTTTDDLVASVADRSLDRIIIRGSLRRVPTLRLAPGQTLQGEGEADALVFADNRDGLQLTSNNEVCNLQLEASPHYRAVFNDTGVESLGRVVLKDITARGQVQLLARDKLRSGHVEVDGLDIISADLRGRPERPKGFGVEVVQGAFTLWNMQADEAVSLTARLVGLSAGRASAPVIGSGIFVSGAGFTGGRLVVPLLETGAVHCNGNLPPGTAGVITGGVFTLHNTFVDQVRTLGPVVTYGVNDMVLDNWGFVERWTVEDSLMSFGPSGIGFVNFGTVHDLIVNAPIETFGQGARGFNLYAGTVKAASFDTIVTHGDGAVGIQISQPVGQLRLRRGIETFGGTGQSLVKGVVTTLSAVGLSVKPGGSVHEVTVEGSITTHGKGISPLEVQGEIGHLSIEGGLKLKQETTPLS